MSANPPVPIPPANADSRSAWAYLEQGIYWIMTHPGESIPTSTFMNLYTVAYNYTVRNVNRGGDPGEQTRANCIGSDLYNSLVRFFISYLAQLCNASESMVGETLLLYYVHEWERYNAGVEDASRLFTCLSRHGQKEKGRREVYQIDTLALVLWKLNFFLHVQKKAKNLAFAIIKLVESERDGKTVNQILLKKGINTFLSMGVEELDTNQNSLEVYEEHFEAPFITATEMYYKIESAQFLATHPLGDYLRWVETRLKEEEDRVEAYLDPSTRKLLIQKCEVVLIQGHSRSMWDAFQQLLDLGQEDDLQRMYSLLARIPQAREGLDPVRDIFGQQVERAGKDAILTLVGVQNSVDVNSPAPKEFVDTLHVIYDKSRHTIDRIFNGDLGFTAVLDKACRKFINHNAVTDKFTKKPPEILAAYADGLLRKSNPYDLTTEGERDDALCKVEVLFKYIDDKDVFQTVYTLRLSKRLIHNCSVSFDAEATMIRKLRVVCGFEFTNKMTRMLADVEHSVDLTQQFNEKPIESTSEMVCFAIKVLGTNHWSLPLAPTPEFVIPRQLLPVYHRFTQFYRDRYQGRKVTWLWNWSKNELRTNYLNQKYILTTSTQQTAILVQFNTKDTLSLDELVAYTGIPEGLLVQMLTVLVAAKILINEETNRYDLNLNFVSKRVRVNLDFMAAKEVDTAVINRTAKERIWEISMKANWIVKRRKVIKNQALIVEVVSQISEHFTPKISEIKKAIETLIEKEYIERVEDQPDIHRMNGNEDKFVTLMAEGNVILKGSKEPALAKR